MEEESIPLDDLNLKKELLDSLKESGIYTWFPIQENIILACTAFVWPGRHVVVKANAGSGKTAALVASALQRINADYDECQALILTPTRDVAQRTQEMMASMGKGLDVKSYACVGGTRIREDFAAVESGQQVVIGKE